MKFQFDHDYHLHSRLSLCSTDPNQSPEQILRYAENNHLRHICLTDHFWDSPDIPGANRWYLQQDFAHISQSMPLPQSPDVRFYFGCETEMSKDCQLAITRRRMEQVDFIIVPTTHMHIKFIVDVDATVEERRAIYLHRIRTLLDMDDLPFRKMGWAHPTTGLIAPNGAWQEVIDGISDAQYLSVLSLLHKRGMGFELNVGDFDFDRLTAGQVESQLRVFRLAKEAGCKFYLASDAHIAEELSAAPARFQRLLGLFELDQEDQFHPFAEA